MMKLYFYLIEVLIQRKNEGEIGGLFYNMLDEDVELKAGDKMMQGIFVKYQKTDDDNAEGERNGGFGSTGK